MHLSRSVLIVKRAMDISIGFFGSLFFISSYPLIALFIKLESKGPALYSQERIGMNGRTPRRRNKGGTENADPYSVLRKKDVGGKPFIIYKYRSMFTDAEKNGPQLAGNGRDPRITTIGWWLRALHLDELPQFWNILKGDMSFIGPRPERAYFTVQFAESIPHYKQRTLHIRPGLTGLAQINLGYDDSLASVVRKSFYDYSYRASFCSFKAWIRLEGWIIWNTFGYLLKPPKKEGEVRDLETLKRAKALPFSARSSEKEGASKKNSVVNLQDTSLSSTLFSTHSSILEIKKSNSFASKLDVQFRGHKHLEVSFTPDVNFDLEDLGFLIEVAQKVKSIGGAISIKNCSSTVRHMLEEIHLDKVIEIKRPHRPVQNFMTIDVECWFHAFNMQGQSPASTWHQQETRIINNIERILTMLRKHNTEATFFILGWVADHFPEVVRMIDKEGHEIGTHGYYHKLITDMTPSEFEADLMKSLEAISRHTSQKILGHRASNFSVVEKTLWSLDIVARNGLTYDSSIFPIQRDRYGIPHYPNRLPHRILLSDNRQLAEFPMSTLGVGKKFMPLTGGGYLRLFPHTVTEMFLEMKNKKHQPVMMYFHPWELDVEQERHNLGMLKTFQHYVNLHTTEWKLERLLEKFSFTSIRRNMETRSVAAMLNRNPVRILDEISLNQQERPMAKPLLNFPKKDLGEVGINI